MIMHSIKLRRQLIQVSFNTSIFIPPVIRTQRHTEHICCHLKDLQPSKKLYRPLQISNYETTNHTAFYI